jgi:hypothetical protein
MLPGPSNTPYPPPVHSWAGWVPKGSARRYTGEEVAERVLGSTTNQQFSLVQQLARTSPPPDTPSTDWGPV